MKFHPASWIALVLFLHILQFPAANRLDAHYRNAVFLFVFVCVLLGLQGKGAVMSSLIDVQITPAILLVALSRLPLEQARAAIALFVWIITLNVLLVALEFVLRTPILPREFVEVIFRPAGLFGHPINAGLLFCCAMLLLTRGAVGTFARRPLMLAFLGGTALCGVRGPLAIAAAIFIVNVIKPTLPRRSAIDYFLDFGVLFAVPIVVTIAYSVGAFDRILSLGVWEESSQSRLFIFDALDWLRSDEFWWGIDSYDRMEELTKSATGGRYIENSFVFITFAAGYPMALLASLSLTFLQAPALRRSLLFAMTFTLAAFATIAFTTKGSSSAGIALAGYWIWRLDYERKHRVQSSP
ncbi:hypothetical protein [Bradyrhizobium amphicarpaeae]|nr:hypothetical protein [Bradyrhizobium amphicarpaeae]